ncbi:ABC transporter ATP-binding protein [Pelagibacterium halotolerans]|uniref:ABC transporter related protein n=1 Tax=Pelagibacterium halotolerans (strain DSM 22347 / JCM 15775 / CGMCC 1.7692 / B2) TaxID=1082931 RepID=G4RAM5_PELHB|nr:ABC transporter ATP-binding protein [Pelagibacterium halotolerans]AEQ52548.1 ABC transporter related protein [Pelagibacterium halotolerans B2]QJR17733.1 ABC transporter ATP-binding protein [Pelagibacterium halotolerans]SEA39820.1 NitT/TauT family transport system ATP-binding protein [Pelagibacterium halotolerans]
MLRVENLSKRFGDVSAIADITAEFPKGRFSCIVGPSGCGKTTLLKCLSGLLEPSGGAVMLDGKPVTAPPKTMALVFQDYSRSLFPWMTVRENVSFPLRGNGAMDKGQKGAAVESALKAVGLADAMDRYPWQLSGGMQQRTSIARAIAYNPEILLMDEPFASVDAQTRADLEDLMLQIKRDYGMTIVFVTHDIDESVYLGDRIVVLAPPPTSVKEVLEVSLPELRDQVATKEHPEFLRLRGHVFNEIMRRTQVAGER